MPTIDMPLRVARLPGRNRAQDEYRLPGSRRAGEAHADATGPGAQAPPAQRAHSGQRASSGRADDAAPDPQGPRHAKAAPPKSGHAAPVRITGKVFALRDGSGYAALGSDGNYYRVDGGAGHGLAHARSGGFVDASMVNVAGGPVSAVQLDAGRAAGPTPPHGADAGRPDPVPRSAAPESPSDSALPGPHAAALADPQHAASRSQDTRELIAGHPRTAMRSQANLPPRNAISLLR